jgi:hypothetical protein
VANNEVKIRFSAEDGLTPVMKKAIESLSGLNVGAINLASGLTILKTGAELVSQGFEKVSEFVNKGIEEALEAEKAQNKLVGALVATGNYSGEAADALNEYAESLEKTVGANGESVKSMIAQGVQMGLTVEKAKELEQASRQLAASQNIDVNEAFQTISRTLTGQSRALAQYIPQVKQLGSANLQTGAAIDLVVKATQDQYNLYQQSLPASLDKARVSIDNVYKAFGQIITQNPLAQRAINGFVEVMNYLEDGIISINNWIKQNMDQIMSWGSAFVKATAVVGGLLLIVPAMTGAITALGAAIAFLTSPIGLTIAAIVALTVAFEKFPGLADLVIGSLKTMAGVMLSLATGPLLLFMTGLGKLIGIFKSDWGNAIDAAVNKIREMEVNLTSSGVEQAKLGYETLKTGEVVQQTAEKDTKATTEMLENRSKLNKAQKELMNTYGDYDTGTERQRKALAAQVEDRNKDLAYFKQYYEARTKLAVDSELEAQIEINKVRQEALKGSGGQQEKSLAADQTIAQEQAKQAQLKKMHDDELISDAQFNEAMSASRMRYQQAELDRANAHSAALADALGESPAAFQLRQQMLQQNFQIEEAMKEQRAQEAGASEDQILQMRAAAKEDMLAKQEQLEEEYYQREAERRQRAGDQWGAFLSQMSAQQAKEGAVMGTLHAVQNSNYYKQENQMLTNVASLRSSHSKKAFELGKKAAIAQAMVQTFMGATEAFTSLAAIPIVGPALGAAAAAAAIAAGFVQIQNIQAQQFDGGQADQGMDAVPQALAGRSFILSAGERVVQPEANKKLTAFLDQQVGDGKGAAPAGKGGTTVNIYVQPTVSKEDARKAVDTMIDEIRKRSEMGQPIINQKAVYGT